jgi:hypothetical protein
VRTAPSVALGATAAACLLVAAACSETIVQHEVPSPDGLLVARYFQVSGGGAAGTVDEYISIDSTDSVLDPFGKGTVLLMSKGGDAELTWVDNRRLKVEIGEWTNVKRQCPLAHGVRIEYSILSEARPSWSTSARDRSAALAKAKQRGEVDPGTDHRRIAECLAAER